MSSRNLCLVIALTVLLVFGMISGPLLKMAVSIDKYNHTIGYIKLFTLFELFFVYTIVPNNYLNAGGHEKLNFGIVLFYCTVIVIGMLAGYVFYKTADGILLGLIAATIIAVIVQHLIVCKKIFAENGWPSTFLIFLPTPMIGVCIVSETILLKSVFFIVSLISLYMIFIRYYKINFNLIKHG